MKAISEEVRSRLTNLLLQDNSKLCYDEMTIVMYYALSPDIISNEEFNSVIDKINKTHCNNAHFSAEYLAWMHSTLFGIYTYISEK